MKALSALNIVAATIAALLLLSSGPIYGLQTEQTETKRILVLYSYHEGLPWEKLIDESFRNTLEFQSDFSIEINVEHTDRIRYADDEYRHTLPFTEGFLVVAQTDEWPLPHSPVICTHVDGVEDGEQAKYGDD